MTKLDTDKFKEDLCFNIKDKFEQTGYEDVSVADMLRRWYSSLIPYTSCLPLLLVTARFLS